MRSRSVPEAFRRVRIEAKKPGFYQKCRDTASIKSLLVQNISDAVSLRRNKGDKIDWVESAIAIYAKKPGFYEKSFMASRDMPPARYANAARNKGDRIDFKSSDNVQ
ncbi:hypothetical protein [Microseira sp. BLCC-F43]|uniref:hypothetical protein n=1 Tax=Microseira sp. BLCC-F43 TaxID=3153602 RepID=UPI0035BBE37A